MFMYFLGMYERESELHRGEMHSSFGVVDLGWEQNNESVMQSESFTIQPAAVLLLFYASPVQINYSVVL
jgi:hypothetical protein